VDQGGFRLFFFGFELVGGCAGGVEVLFEGDELVDEQVEADEGFELGEADEGHLEDQARVGGAVHVLGAGDHDGEVAVE
jgi:hypothetical protein